MIGSRNRDVVATNLSSYPFQIMKLQNVNVTQYLVSGQGIVSATVKDNNA